MEDQMIWVAYSVSNILAVLFIWVSIKRPKLARLLLFLLFGWASWFNYSTAHQQPDAYMMYVTSATTNKFY
jgi:predicted membrane channel-forming protein YqfA (hemolysin III family)